MYHLKYYKVISIDLLRQANTINFVGKLGEDDVAPIIPIAEKQHKTILNFSLDSLFVTE